MALRSIGTNYVSMKSGLGDRNNSATPQPATTRRPRAMKSGLRDRNNGDAEGSDVAWPVAVSMKSGLRDRNNPLMTAPSWTAAASRLNEVRS